MSRIAAALALLMITTAAWAAEITDRMSLVEAIESVRAQGVEIVYSSQLVKPWMRVREAPLVSEPLAALREVLAVYRLGLNEYQGNRWLIVRAASESPASTTFAAATEPDIEQQPLALPPLEEVMIVASRHTLFDREASGDRFLTGEEIRLMPHIADDAFRALHRLPGAAADDFSAPFHIRGGTVKEVKVVLDGLEIFEPFHLRTLFSPLSIIDPGVIGRAQVFSGGFTANFGNHMSGVIDILSDIPDTRPVHELGVSFVNTFARSSGVFASGRGSYQVSGRRGYLDLIADKKEDPGEQLVPRYSDVFARASYVLNDTVDVTTQVLLADDDVSFSQPSEGREVDDKNSLEYAWVAVDYEPSDILTWRSALFTGRVESDEDGRSDNLPEEALSRLYSRNVEISGLQSNLDIRVNSAQAWKVGARYRKLEANYDYFIDSVRFMHVGAFESQTILQRDIDASHHGNELGVFAAYRFQPSKKAVLELGIRWDKQTYTDTSEQTQLSPRANGLLRLAERTDIRFSWGRYHQPQGIQSLQVEDGIDHYFPAERADHRVVGIRHRFKSGVETQVDLYAKRYSNVRPRFENALDAYEFAPESTFDRVRIEPDSARSRGVEFTLRNRQSKGLDWWLNYTWSEAEDEFDGVKVPRSWDQRHAFTTNLSWRGERWSASVIGSYHSGRPRTNLLVVPVLDSAGEIVGINTDLSQRNRGRYDDYSRVDVRLSRDVRLPRSDFEFYFEIFNLFNTTNECCVPGHNLTLGSTIAASPVYDDYLPFFPSFGFVWTFGPGVDHG
jgi:outer membrane cobalamin receptor